MVPTLDNFELYKRFTSGKTEEQSIENYKKYYKNSGYIIGISEEIVQCKFKKRALENQIKMIDMLKRHKKIYIDFYSIGGAIFSNKCLYVFFEKLFKNAKELKTESISLSAPQQLYYNKYKELRIYATNIAEKNNINSFYVTQQAYLKSSLEDVKELIQSCNANIALVCGGFRLVDSNNSNLLVEREEIIESYKNIRCFLKHNNIKFTDNTQNKYLINWLIKNNTVKDLIVNFCYGTNFNVENSKIINKYVKLNVGDYKLNINASNSSNNNSSSHESQS